MNSRMMTVEEARVLIVAGARLLLARDEALLRALPRGNWIGGTTPYFMASQGGLETKQLVMVTRLPDEVVSASSVIYAPDSLSQIPADYPANGVSFIVLPAGSAAHQRFARDGADWPALFQAPLVGWIAGYDLATGGRAAVVDGRTATFTHDAAVVLHCELRADVAAQVDILNVFEPSDGDVLTFVEEGFSPKTIQVNGQTQNFAEYLIGVKADVKAPLVADFAGAIVNVSIQAIDAALGTVALYAPVFAGVEYRLARQLTDYESQFGVAMRGKTRSAIFACNCVLNFLYGNLKGRTLPEPYGPITFGEVAWMLLNQTMVYVTLRPR